MNSNIGWSILYLVIAAVQLLMSFVAILHRSPFLAIAVFIGIAIFHMTLFAYKSNRIAMFIILITVSSVLASDFIIAGVEFYSTPGHPVILYFSLALIYFTGSLVSFKILLAIAERLHKPHSDSNRNS